MSAAAALRPTLPAGAGHGPHGSRGRLEGLRVSPDLRRDVWWGQPWQLATASYWTALALALPGPATYRLGRTLDEEVAACLLGGHGIPGPIGNAAFRAVRDAGLLDGAPVPGPEPIERLLRQPLTVRGATMRYRFPRQRARRLSAALGHVRSSAPPEDDVELRDWLTGAPGIGMKTASWVVRNHRASDRVAIIDVHVQRAGTAAGVFDPAWRLPRQYTLLERAFLAWAAAGGVSAARLDACIWAELAGAGAHARDVLGVARLSDTPVPVWPCAQSAGFGAPHPAGPPT